MVRRAIALAAVLLAAPAPSGAQAGGHSSHRPTDLSFVAPTVTTVRNGPSLKAKVIGSLQPSDIVMAYDAEPGWVHVDLLTDAEPSTGWVQASTMDDVVSASWLDLRMKANALKSKAWPVAIKRDILRLRPRVGFTKQQVELALGEPVSIRTTETAAGERARWAYPGRVVSFAGDRVVEIEKVSTP